MPKPTAPTRVQMAVSVTRTSSSGRRANDRSDGPSREAC
jgi:hypothetical protein